MTHAPAAPRAIALGLALCAALAAVALLPARASAGQSCAGSTSLAKSEFSDNELNYRFGCSIKIRSFTIITSQKLDIFSDIAESHRADDSYVETEVFECGGVVPSRAANCTVQGGRSGTPGHAIIGKLGLMKSPCANRMALRAMVVVSDAKGVTYGPFPLRRLAKKDCAGASARKG